MAANLAGVILERAAQHPQRSFVRSYGFAGWTELSYGAMAERVQDVAGRLVREGVQPGDRVGICGDRCREWLLADLGAMSAGARSVPVAADLPAPAALEQLAGCRAVFAGPEQRDRLAASGLRVLDLLGVRDPVGGDCTDAGARRMHEIAASSDGASALHRECEALCQALAGQVDEADLFLSILPLERQAERLGGYLLPVYLGKPLLLARSLDSLEQDILVGRPAWFRAAWRLTADRPALRARLAGSLRYLACPQAQIESDLLCSLKACGIGVIRIPAGQAVARNSPDDRALP